MDSRTNHGTRTSARLRPRASAPRIARRLVRDVCRSSALPAQLVDDALLVTSELVTSSVKQTRADVDVVVEIADGTVTVRVHQYGDVRPPHSRGAFDRSRAIVTRLSSSWGYSQSDIGRQLWASLRAPQYAAA